MGLLLWSIFIFGFSGSLHCSAMCGGLVSGACPLVGKNVRITSFIVFSLSRLFIYTVLGALSGLLTSMIFRNQRETISEWIGLVFGVFLLLHAIVSLLRAVWPKQRWNLPFSKPAVPTAVKKLFMHINLPKPLFFGAITGVIPCGFLYAALSQAAAFADPVWSAVAMAIFAMATTPALWGGAALIVFLEERIPGVRRWFVPGVLFVTAAIVIGRALTKQPHCH